MFSSISCPYPEIEGSILVQLVLILLLTGWLILAISLTARLCFGWEFDKLPKVELMATKKNLSSLRGHAITSISTSYKVKFTVGKSVPSAKPPYNHIRSLNKRYWVMILQLVLPGMCSSKMLQKLGCSSLLFSNKRVGNLPWGIFFGNPCQIKLSFLSAPKRIQTSVP